METSRVEIEEQFVAVASEVASLYPDIDLRFNLLNGSKMLRFTALPYTSEMFELELGERRTQELIHEVILTIKQVAGLFDA